jgi:hypothetical protein
VSLALVSRQCEPENAVRAGTLLIFCRLSNLSIGLTLTEEVQEVVKGVDWTRGQVVDEHVA